jgi:hypothetical protein
MSLSNSYSLLAAHEALQDARWSPQNDDESYRAGCSVATGISGISEIADAALALSNNGKGYKAISPYFVTKILPNLSSGLISIKYKLRVILEKNFCFFFSKLDRFFFRDQQLHQQLRVLLEHMQYVIRIILSNTV